MATRADQKLNAARAAAELARCDASDANLRAVREAVADALSLRHDGPGYNPYRDHSGRFGAGPHAARPGAGDRIVKGHPDTTPARTALAAAHVAAARARKSPTPENIQAAKTATKHAVKEADRAGLVKQASDRAGKASERANTSGSKTDHKAAAEAHEHAARAHTVAVASSKDSSRTRKRGKPESDSQNPLVPVHTPPHVSALKEAIGQGTVASHDGWEVHGFTPGAQRAVRQHFDEAVGAYGLVARRAPQSHELVGHSIESMGGAAGWHMNTGLIAISHQDLNALAHYSKQSKGDAEYVGRVVADGEFHRGFDSYSTMVHETIHEHGPVLGGNGSHHTHVEEMTTEMAARHIAARAHGIEGHQIKFAGYEEMIEGSVGHVARIAGVSRNDAFDALAKASIEFKSSGTHAVDADSAHRMLAWRTLEHLGVASEKRVRLSEQKQNELVDGWRKEAAKLSDLTATLSTSAI